MPLVDKTHSTYREQGKAIEKNQDLKPKTQDLLLIPQRLRALHEVFRQRDAF
jgi:hypothetical protein